MTKNLLRLCLTGLFSLLVLQSGAQRRVTFKISTAQERKHISPLIYGTNDKYSFATAKRLGGNRLTNYNWENNASNAGRDWYHSSDEYVPWERGVPESEYDVPGSALKYFHNTSLSQQAYSLITLPMARYVTADRNGSVSEAQAAPSIRWKSISHKKNAPFTLTPNLNDEYVYTDEEVNFLIHSYGKSSSPTGVKAYALDNEPGIWFESHSRMWGTNHLPVNFLMNSSFELASSIKSLDPEAEVFGPASWGVSEFEDLQGAPDWASVNNGRYRNFISYYLASMKARQNADPNRTRLLDVLTLHWYPQGRRDGLSPFDDGTDYFTNKARMEMTRSLWDPTYVENTWIGEDPDKVEQFLPFIPKMQATIAQHYPGTKFAITEYSYMGKGHPSGGIAQADALGIFGRQGVYFASYWGAVIDYIKAGFDIYRNYDGKGGSFGDVSVQSSTSDIEVSSVYASVESGDDSRTHVVAMNKSQDDPITVSFEISSDHVFKGARVWAFDANGSAVRQLKNVRVIEQNKFEYVLPPLTVCHLVLTEEDLSLSPDFELAVVEPSAGYSDGTADFQLKAQLVDGDNNITRVTADLSPLGGGREVALELDGNGFYKLDFQVPDGTPSGLKSIPISAIDATGRTAEALVKYRVIKKTSSSVLWDGDEISKGKGEKFHDGNDAKAAQAKIQWQPSGGSTGPGSLFMHFIHGENTYNVLTWRLSPNDNPADSRDISDFGFLEFKIRSNAPSTSDIEFSIRDSSPQLHTSGSVFLRQGGYVSSFNANGYTTVKIPMSALTAGSEIRLDQIWQFNFSVNTASKGFDVWIDDIRVVPYSHPYKEPKLSEVALSRASGYADGLTQVTVSARVQDPDNNLKQVTVDLSELDGPNSQPMTLTGGRYSHTFTVGEGVGHGPRQLRVSAVDSLENSTDARLPYKVIQVASSLNLWDGDLKNTGEGVTVNTQTTVKVDSLGGNQGPISLDFHFDKGKDDFAGGMWDWNMGTGDTQLQDLSDKRYLNFYVKVTPPRPDFDLEVYMKDRYGASTPSFRMRDYGWVSSYTGSYQLIRIPLSVLFENKAIDETQVGRFGLLSNQFDGPMDFKVDDISASGSRAHDVRISSTNPQCGKNGVIKVESVDQPGPLSYYINGVSNPAGLNNPVFAGLDTGSYLIRITGTSGFVYMERVTLAGTGGNFAVNGTVSPGKVTVSVTGGSGDYLYLWSNGATTADLVDVPAGSYTLTVTDQLTGCKAYYTALVEGRQISYQVIDAACAPNGKISVTRVPVASGPLSYYLNGVVNPAGARDSVFVNLLPGTYLVRVTGRDNFTDSVQVAVGGWGSAPVLSAVAKSGNITLTITGGSGSYAFLWSNGFRGKDLVGVPEGNYSVNVSDTVSGCSASLNVVLVASSTVPVLTVSDAQCAANGSIMVTDLPSGLTGVSYFINGAVNPAGGAKPLFTGLKPGAYTIKVTASGGYSFQGKATVGGYGSAPVITGSSRNGNIDITVKGGSGVYIYQWSNGSDTQDLMQVPDGNYTVVVTDAASGCKSSFTMAAVTPVINLLASPASCAANGTITVSKVSGGNGTYSYYINGALNPSGAANPVFTGLKPASYMIKVQDNAGFVISRSMVVEGYGSAPVITGTVKGNSITTSIKGGSGIYLYQWSEGSTTQHLYQVADGSYTLTVTDAASGCTGSYTATVFTPSAEVKVVNAACGANGAITVSSTNATGPISYYLNGQGNADGISSPLFSGLTPGNYTVKVLGGNGFTWSKVVSVGGQGNPPLVSSTVSGSNVNLQVSGGSGSYDYQWSNGATTRNLAEVPAGNYSVKVRDAASGCQTQHVVTVSEPIKVETIVIYPNPVSAYGTINVKFNFTRAASRTFSLKELTGRVIWKKTITSASGEESIQPQGLKMGIYLLHVDGLDATVKRVLVQ